MTTRRSRRLRAGLLGGLAVLVWSGFASWPAGGSEPTRASTSSPAASLVTYDYGTSRSGDDRTDPRIARLSARATWSDELDGAVYGEPLILGTTTYVATENDSLYAIGARSGSVLWHVHVGTTVPLSIVDSAPTVGCGDINPLGITGTPVIDPSAGEIFVSEETTTRANPSWRSIEHWIVAISLTTHRALWHRRVDPPRPNNESTYYVAAEQQRGALTLLGGHLYVAFGGLDGDCGQYHGYVVGLSESGSGALLSYQVPSAREGAIWATNGILVGSDGDLFVATGNAASDNPANYDEGNSVIELSPSLVRRGVWAPSNWAQLSADDWDLGSAGPVEVPGTTLLFVAGKPASTGSYGYLMREGHLGGVGHGAFTGAVCPGGGAFGADASDVIGHRVLVFVPCGSGTEALEINTAAMSFRRLWSSSTASPNGSPIVAGGVVWALNWNDGVLVGMNPLTGHVFVERSTSSLDHFATPSVGDEMVVVPTSSGIEAFRATS